MIDIQTQNFVAVMLAFLANKPVEYRMKGWKNWLPVEVPSWNWVELEYRIKPEVVKYRRMVCRTAEGHYVAALICLGEDPQYYEQDSRFVRWIDSDWIEEHV